MDRKSTEKEELYSCRPSEGLWVPMMITPESIEGGILGEEEVVQAVQSLKRGRYGGLSGMRVENLK